MTVEITNVNGERITPAYVQELSHELPAVEEISEDMRLTAFNHATPITRNPKLAVRFFGNLLGLRNAFEHANPDQTDSTIVAIGNEEQRDFLRYIASPTAPAGYVGTGNVHHIAMAVEDDGDQLRIMRQLNDSGVGNSGIVDWFWFKSLYFRDPDGNLLEIATNGPGYAVDEPQEKLGSRLVLAP